MYHITLYRCTGYGVVVWCGVRCDVVCCGVCGMRRGVVWCGVVCGVVCVEWYGVLCVEWWCAMWYAVRCGVMWYGVVW